MSMYWIGISILSLAVAGCILYPFFAYADVKGVARDAGMLQDHKSRCVQVLRDLELDFATQKISEEDYQKTKHALEFELADILTKLDTQEKSI